MGHIRAEVLMTSVREVRHVIVTGQVLEQRLSLGREGYQSRTGISVAGSQPSLVLSYTMGHKRRSVLI